MSNATATRRSAPYVQASVGRGTTPSTRLIVAAHHARRAVLAVGVFGFGALALAAGVAVGADVFDKIVRMFGA